MNNHKKIYKDAFKVGAQLVGYLLVFSFILSMSALFFIRRGDIFSISYIFGVLGIAINILFLNSIGTFTVNIILVLLITFFIFYFVLKKKIMNYHDLREFIIYTLIIAFVVSFVTSILSYIFSFIRLDIYSSEQAIYKANFFINFIKTYIKSVLFILIIKIYLYDNNKLNSGIVAFKRYFYLITIYTFVVSVLIEVYIMYLISGFPYYTSVLNLGVILGIFNVMGYLLLFLFGGVLSFSAIFLGNTNRYLVSFLDIYTGQFGLFVLIFYIIGILILFGIIFLSIKKLKEESFIKDSIVFVLLVVGFNILLSVFSSINMSVQFLSLRLQFPVIPIIISTLILTSIVVSVKYILIIIKKSI